MTSTHPHPHLNEARQGSRTGASTSSTLVFAANLRRGTRGVAIPFFRRWRLFAEATAAQDPVDELERQLHARIAELERRNGLLREELDRQVLIAQELRREKAIVEAAGTARRDFLAQVSHEIRTALNGLLGVGNLLRGTALTQEQADLVQALTREGHSLRTMLNDVLDLSKIEAGGLTLEHIDFDLREQLQLAVLLCSDDASAKGLQLFLELDPAVPTAVSGDPVRLRQIVLNLMSNAVKFTPRGGNVVLKVRLDERASARFRLRFEVMDTGIGIPAHVQALLFRPYVQAEPSTSRRHGGTGLGLAICKRLIELMHGEIGVKSVPGSGSRFWFTLELDAAQPAAHPAAAQSSPVVCGDARPTPTGA
ncbi:ATP-binding protein [Opitutus sp. ER46]|uniref:ATP-binding protein n=1 Tax=Opitutus sp. ER46 TaxID=2161864 RepID=UPI001304D71F|nr:ATP-binding protein [Opitutus sp. ER46]